MSSTLYQGQHRQNLDNDDDIEALERAKRGEPETPQEPEPPVENEPEAPKEPPKGAAEDAYAKRYADLRRHAAQTEQRLKQELDAIKAQLDTATKRSMNLPSSEEEIAQWTRDYPDVARIVESIASKKADERVTSTEARIKASEARERDSAKRAAIAELLRLHPDFNDLTKEPAFHDWAHQQPQWIQASLYNDLDPRAAARAIDLYKMDTAPKRGRPKADPVKDAAQEVRVNSGAPKLDPNEGKKTYRESEVAKMSTRDFERQEDDILVARREGRFVYDMQAAS